MAIFSLWFLYTQYRRTDELLWAATSSGVLLATSFLVFSLGQGYYSMMLFPTADDRGAPGFGDAQLARVARGRRCMTFDSFISKRFAAFGRMLEYNKVTWAGRC